MINVYVSIQRVIMLFNRNLLTHCRMITDMYDAVCRYNIKIYELPLGKQQLNRGSNFEAGNVGRYLGKSIITLSVRLRNIVLIDWAKL